MGLVRMKHEDLAGDAQLGGAAVAEGLDAGEREADGIGVMPVRIEGMAREKGFDPLQSRA
jgi:hypothetical protein